MLATAGVSLAHWRQRRRAGATTAKESRLPQEELSFVGEVLPNWLAAIGTVGATAVAVYLAWVEKRRADAAENQRDDLIEAERVRVASRVGGRLERLPDEVPVGPRWRDRDRRPESWRVHVKNGSDQTITDVQAYAIHSDGTHQERLASWKAIPPGEAVQADEEIRLQQYNETPWLLLRFTDPTGRRWEQGESGAMHEPTPDRPSERSR